ncbi:hypothetical protein AMATHDRAFT_75379 [Amanita thiersii Skay4041]|uniref:Uncharacterized protein n=1 Tax=Amanita thiersii Skay4041 TaxID=703135 RepID=A0A2A9NNA6_9AGAR|nr:hypothetical protein AMATHDRAFT_75379 [Amanita thiersii Skay4041]
MPDSPAEDSEQKQCRICLDGTNVEHELGRLIRPCLCKGSIRLVHVKCLQRWRTTFHSKSAFYSCPQCHYQYRFARTRVVGLATNPVIVGGFSALMFTFIVMLASFIASFFMSSFEEPTWAYWGILNPYDVTHDLITAAYRIIKDGDTYGILEDGVFTSNRQRDFLSNGPLKVPTARPRPGLVLRLIRRFLLGLPVVGAGSIVHMLLSAPLLGPIHWIARYRGGRRRNNSRDIAALIVVGLLIVGIARAIYHVYQLTQRITKRLLLRAEDVILEVNN